MTSSLQRDDALASPELADILEVQLRLGAAMMRSGNTAFRTRECMDAMASRLGLDAISVGFTLDSIVASARRGVDRAQMVRVPGNPGVNARRSRGDEQRY